MRDTTAIAESLNSTPGAKASRHGGGFHRYRAPLFGIFGYYRWEQIRLRSLLKSSSSKLRGGHHLVIEAAKVLNSSLGLTPHCNVVRENGNVVDVYNSSTKKTYVVDLNRWTCTCTLFQRNQIACKHAVKAIQQRRGDVYEYVTLTLTLILGWASVSAQYLTAQISPQHKRGV